MVLRGREGRTTYLGAICIASKRNLLKKGQGDGPNGHPPPPPPPPDKPLGKYGIRSQKVKESEKSS